MTYISLNGKQIISIVLEIGSKAKNNKIAQYGTFFNC